MGDAPRRSSSLQRQSLACRQLRHIVIVPTASSPSQSVVSPSATQAALNAQELHMLRVEIAALQRRAQQWECEREQLHASIDEFRHGKHPITVAPELERNNVICHHSSVTLQSAALHCDTAQLAAKRVQAAGVRHCAAGGAAKSRKRAAGRYRPAAGGCVDGHDRRHGH